MGELVNEIYEQLMADIAPTRDGDSSFLLMKVKSAYREVKQTRHYPEDAPQEVIDADMERYSSAIYNLALYDFNIRGAEFESTINENGEYRIFVDRRNILAAVTPMAIVV